MPLLFNNIFIQSVIFIFQIESRDPYNREPPGACSAQCVRSHIKLLHHSQEKPRIFLLYLKSMQKGKMYTAIIL